ncbi:MAG: hypothetical protein QJR08_04260 [Bacillota bacterium]|nr:hypothetical protein [Bacillota bacterium]
MATLDELLQAWVDVAGIRTRSQFAAGDVAAEAVREHGRGVIPVLAEHARRSARWVQMVIAVAQTFPPDVRERYAELPWTVFRQAARDRENPERWLRLAQDEGLSERDLAARMRGRRPARWQGECDCGARVHVVAQEDAAGETVRCPRCGQDLGVLETR